MIFQNIYSWKTSQWLTINFGGMNFVTDVTQPDYENTFIFVLQANPKSSDSGFPGSLLKSYG